jgi:hypothetical protein
VDFMWWIKWSRNSVNFWIWPTAWMRRSMHARWCIIQYMNLEIYSWEYQYRRDWIYKSIDTGNDSNIHTSLTRFYTAHLLTPFCSNDSGRIVHYTESPLISIVYVLWAKVMLFQNISVFLEKTTTGLLKAVTLARLVAWGFRRGAALLLRFIKSMNSCSPACSFISHHILWCFLCEFIS